MNGFIMNIEKLHTTQMGAERIKRNLNLEADDVVLWCKEKILKENAQIERAGKNWYVSIDGYKITVNVSSYTIITAHTIKTGQDRAKKR